MRSPAASSTTLWRVAPQHPPAEGTRFGFSAPAWITLKDDPDGRFVLTPTRTGNLAMGRFLQKDPVPTDGENPYAYARNNPVLWTDAEGHQAGDVVVGGEEVGVSVLEAIAAVFVEVPSSLFRCHFSL